MAIEELEQHQPDDVYREDGQVYVKIAKWIKGYVFEGDLHVCTRLKEGVRQTKERRLTDR